MINRPGPVGNPFDRLPVQHGEGVRPKLPPAHVKALHPPVRDQAPERIEEGRVHSFHPQAIKPMKPIAHVAAIKPPSHVVPSKPPSSKEKKPVHPASEEEKSPRGNVAPTVNPFLQLLERRGRSPKDGRHPALHPNEVSNALSTAHELHNVSKRLRSFL